MNYRLFTLASATSLVLFIAVAVLWVRSECRADRVSWVSRGDRYTLRSEAGRLTYCVPPLPPRAPPKPLLDPAGLELTNEHVHWIMLREWPNFPDVRPGQFWGMHASVAGIPSERARRVFSLSDTQLLRQLDDRRTFVAAHLILVGQAVFDGATVRAEHRDDSCTIVVDGLEVTLHPKDKGYNGSQYYESTAEIDPSQQDRIRDQWHRRLDVTRASVRYRTLALATLALPSLIGVMRVRRWRLVRRRRHRGLCVGCGYDVRVSKECCPECGARLSSG